ncbi:MAG TPA: PHB depolymerase family esterase [Actinomycetota bacterium]
MPVARPALAGLALLLLAACTGGSGEDRQASDQPAGRSLRLTVVSVPLNCQEVPGMPAGCQVGGSGAVTGLGKVRVYASVKLGGPRPGGCREATATGSLNGAGWSAPFAGGGEWCGQRARLTYRLNGPDGPEGRLEYRHDPPAAPAATFTGALPAPPAAQAGRDPGRRVDSAGCGQPPPVRPGRSSDLEIKADPATSAGATRRGYRLHVPAGYRPDRPVPAVLLLHGNGGSAADLDDVSGLSELGDRLGFLAVYPQGLAIGAGRSFWAVAGRVESGVDELRFMADLLDDLQGRLRVDPARVAAGGFSAGGGVAARLACDLAGRVASVAVVAGALYSEPGECTPSRAVPVLDMHGTADVVVPYRGRTSTVDWPLPMPPVPNWLADWATRDGCPGEPAVFLDTPGVSEFRWSGCRDGAEVVHYRINGGDHQAPRAIDGKPFAEVVWEFFAAHPLAG